MLSKWWTTLNGVQRTPDVFKNCANILVVSMYWCCIMRYDGFRGERYCPVFRNYEVKLQPFLHRTVCLLQTCLATVCEKQRRESADGAVIWPHAEKEIHGGKSLPFLVQHCDKRVSFPCHESSKNPSSFSTTCLWVWLLSSASAEDKTQEQTGHWAWPQSCFVD